MPEPKRDKPGLLDRLRAKWKERKQRAADSSGRAPGAVAARLATDSTAARVVV
jgi:hypothetical protein